MPDRDKEYIAELKWKIKSVRETKDKTKNLNYRKDNLRKKYEYDQLNNIRKRKT